MKDKKGITIERVFDAPREMVWRAWTEPEMAKRWWAPKDFTAPSIKIDPTVYGMNADMPEEMDVVVTFEEAGGGKTRLTIEYPRPESEEKFQAMLKSGMEEGWNSSLDKLAQSLR